MQPKESVAGSGGLWRGSKQLLEFLHGSTVDGWSGFLGGELKFDLGPLWITIMIRLQLLVEAGVFYSSL